MRLARALSRKVDLDVSRGSRRIFLHRLWARVRFQHLHGRLRIQQRGLSARQIEAAIVSPDRLMPSFKGRGLAQKAVGTQTLEVVYKRVNDAAVIITAYWLEEGA